MPTEVETQDVVSVGSRVSWGAVFAGAVVALTLCIFLSVLGVALGLTFLHDTNTRAEHIATGAGIWTIVSLLIALFVGGLVTSRTTVGERKGEAMMYGVLVWAVLVGMMAAISAAGTSAYFGFGNYMNRAGQTIVQPHLQQGLNVETARQAGITITTEQANRYNELQHAAQRPADDRSPVAAAWWAFAGIGFSLFAAIAGALLGAGPELVLRYWAGRRVLATPPPH
jgi:hypothetical protein